MNPAALEPLRRSLRALLLMLTLLGSGNVVAAATDLPPDSVYQLDAPLSDQEGHAFQLADKRGRVQLVAMFYTSCAYVCPLIIDSAKGIEHALSDAEREKLGLLLVSLDPARDDTAALKYIADKRKLDPQH